MRNSLVIFIIILVFSIGLISIFIWEAKKEIPTRGTVFQEKEEIASGILPEWKTYQNKEFNFEFKHPPDWMVIEEENGKSGWFGKKFTLYKDENNLKILIIPYGLYTSAPTADMKVEDEIYFAGRKAKALLYLTGDGNVWKKEIFSIQNIPQSWIPEIWKDDLREKEAIGGYVGVYFPIRNQREELLSSEECGGYENCVRIFGQIDKKHYEIADQILSTFKFIEWQYSIEPFPNNYGVQVLYYKVDLNNTEELSQYEFEKKNFHL